MKPTTRVLILGSLAATVLGCGSKENVSLSATILNPDVQVTALALGTELAGGFELRLELGKQAPEPTEVQLGAFSLRRDQTEIVSPLPLVPDSGVSFPLSVAVGEVKAVRLSFDSSSLLDASQRDAICQGPLKIVGTVTDTLSADKATSAESSSVAPTCPVQ